MIKKAILSNKSKYAVINIPHNLTLKANYLIKKAPWSYL